MMGRAARLGPGPPPRRAKYYLAKNTYSARTDCKFIEIKWILIGNTVS